MKRLFLTLISLAIALCCAACAEPVDTPSTPPQASVTQTETTAPSTEANSTAEFEGDLLSVSTPIITENKYSDSNILISYYEYQDISVILPDADVAEAITLDMLNRIDQTASAANSIHNAAQSAFSDQPEWQPYFFKIDHCVTRFDQNVLSFYGNEVSYDGSPRGNSASVSASYDLTSGKALSLNTIFFEDYSADALCDLIIEGLGSYTNGELFADYQAIIRQMFSTNTPVYSWYFSNEGLCFYFAPYEIGNFASGTIVSVIPYEKLSGLLNDIYFPVEELTYTGTVKFESISNDDLSSLEKYTQLAEVVLEESSQKLVISVEGSVTDLAITLADNSENNTGTMVFTASGLGSTDAVIIEATNETIAKLTISYKSDGNTVTTKP